MQSIISENSEDINNVDDNNLESSKVTIDNDVNNNEREEAGRKSVVQIIIYILIGLFVAITVIFFIVLKPAKQMTVEYNNCISNFNSKAEEFNKVAETVDVNNISGIANHIDYLPTQDTSYLSVIKSIFNGNSVDKIRKDIETINTFSKNIDEDMLVLKELNCPSKEWVVDRLNAIELISGTEYVSEGNDPNGLLKKEDGGYEECVYFSLSNIKQNEVEGDSIVDKGTDCGGAIEIFKTKEDAEARCEYLAEYDNTILYSGSYAIVGTMVVRVSYILTNEQQYYITDLIVSAFTAK